MNIADGVKFLHILSAMTLVGGIVGRQLTRSSASKTTELETFIGLTALSGRFEGLMVQPGNLAVVLSGVILAVSGMTILDPAGSPINWPWSVISRPFRNGHRSDFIPRTAIKEVLMKQRLGKYLTERIQ
jgi:hypothetical protein